MATFSFYSRSAINKAKTVFEKELKIENISFLWGKNLPTEVSVVEIKNGTSTLSPALKSTLASYFFHSAFDRDESNESRAISGFLLMMAHEKGHIIVNNRCMASNSDPKSKAARAEALGLSMENGFKSGLDVHVHTAEEAYCDMLLLHKAKELYPSHFMEVAKVFSTIRKQHSVGLPLFKGDGYRTWPALDKAVSDGTLPSPAEAAQMAYDASVKGMGLKKAVELRVAWLFGSNGIEGKEEIEARIAKARVQKTLSESEEPNKALPPKNGP